MRKSKDEITPRKQSMPLDVLQWLMQKMLSTN